MIMFKFILAQIAKLNCLEETDCINCDKCFNWYHLSCTNLSKKDFNTLSSTVEQMKNFCATYA